MKKIVSIVLLLSLWLSAVAGIHTYQSHSVLANGSWVKIRVSESGVCKMTFSELEAAGISHPAQVRVYGYGGAMKTQDFSKPNIDDLPQVPVFVGRYTILLVEDMILQRLASAGHILTMSAATSKTIEAC